MGEKQTPRINYGYSRKIHLVSWSSPAHCPWCNFTVLDDHFLSVWCALWCVVLSQLCSVSTSGSRQTGMVLVRPFVVTQVLNVSVTLPPGAPCTAQSLATVFIIICVFPSPRPFPCINTRFIQGRGRGDGNTKMIIKTVASDCAAQ